MKSKLTTLLALFLISAASLAAADQLRLLQRDPAGYGALYQLGSKLIVVTAGTSETMGAAHGYLLREMIPHTVSRTMALIGAGLAASKGEWFPDKLDEIQRRATPHTPERFLRECRAMAAAAGVPERDVMHYNFFTELFHCSGVAVRNSATLDGAVIHARVLDYMRDINLQHYAVLQLFIPDDSIPWLSVGYAGFLGTVTALNNSGVAIGEMGGKGEGNWDGMPMNFLMRQVAEQAHSVAEALELMRLAPRTCEYHYVLSDAGGAMAGVYATPEVFQVLQPGEQDRRLPQVHPDSVIFSAGKRAEKLSQRIGEQHGKITPEVMIEIIKRPVAMRSNLHNAIFMPTTGDLWFSDAGRATPACDEPYTRVNLQELLARYYRDCQSE